MDPYLHFRLPLFHTVSYFFFLYRSLSFSICTVFYSISSHIDEVLSINPSANVFVFGDFDVHYKDWLFYSGGTDRPDELIIFLSQMTLLKWLTFLLGSLIVMLTFLLCWIYFYLLTLLFVIQWLSIHWEILIMLFSQSPLTFCQTQKQDTPFHCMAYDYSHTDWDGLLDYLRDVRWEDIFKLSASAAASEFCERILVGTDVHIPHHKYQVKPHSSLWFLAACATAIAH